MKQALLTGCTKAWAGCEFGDIDYFNGKLKF